MQSAVGRAKAYLPCPELVFQRNHSIPYNSNDAEYPQTYRKPLPQEASLDNGCDVSSGLDEVVALGSTRVLQGNTNAIPDHHLKVIGLRVRCVVGEGRGVLSHSVVQQFEVVQSEQEVTGPRGDETPELVGSEVWKRLLGLEHREVGVLGA